MVDAAHSPDAFCKEVKSESTLINVWPQYLYVRDYVSEQVLM